MRIPFCLATCALSLAAAAPAQAADSVLSPVGSPDGLGRVNQVVGSADGQTVLAGGIDGARYVVSRVDPGAPGRVASTSADEASEFDLTGSGRYLALGARRFDVATGTPVKIKVGAGSVYGQTLGPDGSVYIAKEHRLLRLGPDGRVTTVRRLPFGGWGAVPHGVGWCGQLRPARFRPPASPGGPLFLGLLNVRTHRLTLASTHVTPTNGFGECVTSLNGRTTGTLVSTRGGARSVIVVRSAGRGVRRFRVPARVSSFDLSPDGRFVLAGDIDINRGVCATDASIGGVLLLDTATGRRRLVRFHGRSLRGGRACAEEPTWGAGSAALALPLDGDVLLVHPATGRSARISMPGADAAPLAFTPDGARIVVESSQSSVDWYAYLVEAPAAAPVKLTGGGFVPAQHGSQPSDQRGLWFAGGRVYVADEGRALFSTPLDGFGQGTLRAPPSADG